MKKILLCNLYNFIFLSWLELVFQLSVFDEFSKSSVINIFLYTLFCSVLITILTTFFNKKVNKVNIYIIYTILPVLYSIQLVFKNMFNTFFSFSLFALTDQALEFSGTIFKLILNNIIFIILFFAPLIITIIFKNKIVIERVKNIKHILLEIILLLLSITTFHLYLNTQKGEYLSGYSLYYEVNQNSLNIQKLGVLNSYKLDLYRVIFGFKEKIKSVNTQENKPKEDDIFDYEYNNLDLNLDKIKDKNSTIYNYIIQNSGTKKNKYTGIFEGKNLIYIVAESFSEIAIDKDLTPTLYKLTNSGFVFDNFYTPNYLSTIGGEFQALTGLSASHEILSTWRSGKNYFPFGLSNVFENLDYKTYAYHDHSGYFQDRYKYLSALGFDNFKACYFGLEKDINCNIWPESDVEMIDKTTSDYLNSDEPFMTYYMTVSGHLGYTFGNAMAKKHRDEVEDLPYSTSVKAYQATQIELDRALELLLERLEEAGKLDDTVIVMLADHYPYGLTLSEINEISKYERDSIFEVNHNKLIIYNSKLKTVNIDKPCASIDVLPTVYNLFGIDYDSRLFAGSDILSNNEGVVLFENRSWISDKAIYDSSKNTYKSRTGEDVSKDYIDHINSVVNNKIAFSKEIINKNFYSVIFEK